MRILFAIPRYRFIWPAAEAALVDVLLAAHRRGHHLLLPMPEAQEGAFIEDLRDEIVRMALASEHVPQVIVMLDADTYARGDELLNLAEACVREGWTVLGMPCPRRGGGPSWHHPPEGTTPTGGHLEAMWAAITHGTTLAMEGYVGTGAVAVTVAQLGTLPPPWFRRDPSDPKAGEDIWFCRRVLASGGRVGLHLGLWTARHCGAQVWTARDLRATVLTGIQRGLDALAAASVVP